MEITRIGTLIYVVRGQRVAMDRDLATLYGVQTGALNQAVSRNRGPQIAAELARGTGGRS